MLYVRYAAPSLRFCHVSIRCSRRSQVSALHQQTPRKKTKRKTKYFKRTTVFLPQTPQRTASSAISQSDWKYLPPASYHFLSGTRCIVLARAPSRGVPFGTVQVYRTRYNKQYSRSNPLLLVYPIPHPRLIIEANVARHPR